MSIETRFFPESGGKASLLRHLVSLDFSRTDNPFFPGPAGSIHFMWFDKSDYRSSDGMSASVFPLNGEVRAAFKTNASYGIWTRTSIRANSFDRGYQNVVNRTARKQFGGFFINDHYGRNRHNPKETVTSTPAERGIEALRAQLSSELESLMHALPEDQFFNQIDPGHHTKENDPSGIWKVMQQFSPAKSLYNAVIPFLVAVVEHFFSGVFGILWRYHPNAQDATISSNRKVSAEDLIAVSQGDRKVEEVVASWYSFQNLDSIQKAFTEFFQVDVWKCLRQRRKIGKRVPLLAAELNRIIDFRHGVVHRFSLDRDLSREELFNMILVVDAILDAVTEDIRKQYPKLIQYKRES